MVRDGSIQFQVSNNPDIKCKFMAHAHKTIRDRSYNYLTFNNSYRNIDILPKFVKAYNNTGHSTTGIGASRVIDADVLAIWRRMECKRQRVPVSTATFIFGQHVRISKEK